MKAQQFRSMPPKRHDRDLEQSDVVRHIADTLDCDLDQAERTFRYLRNKGHLVFSPRGRFWRGAEYVPEESESEARARMQGEINALRVEVSRLADLVTRLRAAHNSLADEFHAQD